MTKPAEIAAMVKHAEDTLGSVDVLVNNAGIQHVAPIEEFPVEKWDAIIAINLSASFHAIRAAVLGMKKRGWGRIINTASAHSLVASPFKSAYVSAKHGIAGLTKAVALEVAPEGITCNAIMPGTVLTDVIKSQLANQAKVLGCSEEEAMDRVFTQNHPTKRLIDASEIGDTVAFLCSESAKSITGVLLPVDGGYTAR
jgi:3-hydroxybutyrate dehydrogenase